MNGRVCKTLRRLAEQVTVGKPTRQLVAGKRYQKNIGSADKPQVVDRVTAQNNPATTRGVYRELKKRYRVMGWKMTEPARAAVE